MLKARFGTKFFLILCLASFSGQATAASPNDNIQNATLLTIDSASDYLEEAEESTNVGASAEVNEASHAGNTASKSVWFKWLADTGNPVTLYTTGSNFDTVLAVYTETGLQTQTAVAENDDETLGVINTSLLSFTPTIGQTYYIAVDGYAGATGEISLRLTRATQFVTGKITLPYTYSNSTAEKFFVFLMDLSASGVQPDLKHKDKIPVWFDTNSNNDRHFRLPLLGNEGLLLGVSCYICDDGHPYLTTFYDTTGNPTPYQSKALILNPATSYASDITVISGNFWLKGTLQLIGGVPAEPGTYYGFIVTAKNTALPNAKTVFFEYAEILPGNASGDFTLYLPPGTSADQFEIKIRCESTDACREYASRAYLDLDQSYEFSYQDSGYRYPGRSGGPYLLYTLDLLASIPQIFIPIKSKNGKVVIINL